MEEKNDLAEMDLSIGEFFARPWVHIPILIVVGAALFGFGIMEFQDSEPDRPKLKQPSSVEIQNITGSASSLFHGDKGQIETALNEYTKAIKDYNDAQLKLWEVRPKSETTAARKLVPPSVAFMVMFAGIGCLVSAVALTIRRWWIIVWVP